MSAKPEDYKLKDAYFGSSTLRNLICRNLDHSKLIQSILAVKNPTKKEVCAHNDTHAPFFLTLPAKLGYSALLDFLPKCDSLDLAMLCYTIPTPCKDLLIPEEWEGHSLLTKLITDLVSSNDVESQLHLTLRIIKVLFPSVAACCNALFCNTNHTTNPAMSILLEKGSTKLIKDFLSGLNKVYPANLKKCFSEYATADYLRNRHRQRHPGQETENCDTWLRSTNLSHYTSQAQQPPTTNHHQKATATTLHHRQNVQPPRNALTTFNHHHQFNQSPLTTAPTVIVGPD